MSVNEVLGTGLHVLYIFSHLIFKNNQHFKVCTIISSFHRRTQIGNLKKHHNKWGSQKSNLCLSD